MEDVFNIMNEKNLDKLEYKKEKGSKKILNFINKNKFITFAFSSFIALSIINFYLMYSFMKILGNI